MILKNQLNRLVLDPKSFVKALLYPSSDSPSSAGARSFLRTKNFGFPKERAPTAVIFCELPLDYTLKLAVILAQGLQSRGYKLVVLALDSTQKMVREYFSSVPNVEVYLLEDYVPFGPLPKIFKFVRRACRMAKSDFLKFKNLTYKKAPISLNAIASFTAAQVDGVMKFDKKSLSLLRSLLWKSALYFEAATRFLTEIKADLVIAQEKGFVGTCEIFYSSTLNKIDYVQWVSCHEPDSMMFKRFKTENLRDHPFSIAQETWSDFREREWREDIQDQVLQEFEKGYKQGNWFKYKNLTSNHQFLEKKELMDQLGLDPNKKTAVIYSHILNDANLFYGKDLFARGFEQWLVETVRAAQENDRVNWVVKLHPANVWRNARAGYTGEYGEILALKKAFGEVPKFLKLIMPEDKRSPFSYFGISDWGITVRGTVGIELSCFGVPVLTAGTGRYSNKGFTVDFDSSTAYLNQIKKIEEISPLTEAQRRLALLHAFLMFKLRPARYSNSVKDIYIEKSQSNPAGRDIEVAADSTEELLTDPQWKSIFDFLQSAKMDFIDGASDRIWDQKNKVRSRVEI